MDISGASTRDASDASDKDSTGSTYHTLKRAEAKPRKGTGELQRRYFLEGSH